jgi:uracil-DNA glycosylase family 4
MADRIIASGPRNAKVAIVGMGPAREEMATGKPFTGPAGHILNDALQEIGYPREKCYVTNVHDSFLPPGTSLFQLPSDVLTASTNRLRRELEVVKPHVIIPLGDEPLRVICGLSGIQKWRGSILPSTITRGTKCVPSVHPAWIVRGMWKWLPVFTHVDLKRAISESTTPNIQLPKRNAITGPSESTVLDFIEEADRHADVLSVDIEVYGYTSRGTGEIGCVGIGTNPDEALCIPFIRQGNEPYWSLQAEARIWCALARLLQNPRIRKVGQNLAFEWIYFWLHRIYPANLWIDTMHLHHTLYPDFGGTEDVWGRRTKTDEPGHGLAFINSQYTRTPYYKDDGRRIDTRGTLFGWWRYNCLDVMCTLDAALQMFAEATEEGLWDFYCEYPRAAFPHYARQEWYGVAIDKEKRATASIELGQEITELQDRINQRVGRSFNVQSPVQMREYLYGTLGLKPKINRKTGRITADKGAIQDARIKTQDEVLSWIEALKAKKDLKGDIVDQPLGEDGRMHTHYKIGGTDTNRRSSAKSIMGTGTNLQNVPVKGISRSLFIAESDYNDMRPVPSSDS